MIMEASMTTFVIIFFLFKRVLNRSSWEIRIMFIIINLGLCPRTEKKQRCSWVTVTIGGGNAHIYWWVPAKSSTRHEEEIEQNTEEPYDS